MELVFAVLHVLCHGSRINAAHTTHVVISW